MSTNLDIYNKLRSVPSDALKKINGGRLSGMSDINPMWRIKSLTEVFGVCGFGWRYEIVEQRLEKGSNEQISAFVTINLFIKIDGEWSSGIPGVGGSSFVTNESKGLYTSDECFKMALTDAIGVACKAIGVAADIYFEKDRTKYNTQPPVQSFMDVNKAIDEMEAAKSRAEMTVIWNKYVGLQKDVHFMESVERISKLYPKTI